MIARAWSRSDKMIYAASIALAKSLTDAEIAEGRVRMFGLAFARMLLSNRRVIVAGVSVVVPQAAACLRGTRPSSGLRSIQVFPDVSRIREVSHDVACAVIKQAVEEVPLLMHAPATSPFVCATGFSCLGGVRRSGSVKFVALRGPSYLT